MGAIYSPEDVFNQSPPLENYNLFDSDCALKEAVHREGGGWIDAEACKLGKLFGKPETINLGVFANRFTPELRTHDRFGNRIDEGTICPLTMTFSAIPSLRLQPELATEWEPRALCCDSR